jgi:hypothetical protein
MEKTVWCLTVPAMWSDGCKDKMRAAASKACEPEAGRHFGMHLTLRYAPHTRLDV